MLQTVDDSTGQGERAGWMRLLACAAPDLLEAWAQGIAVPPFTWLRRPEIGLVMVEGRIGNEGARFNFGEMTVTRCALRLASGQCGVGYVRGRAPRHAELAAIADALLQKEPERAAVEAGLLGPLRERRDREAAAGRRRARATRVEFFTVARGED